MAGTIGVNAYLIWLYKRASRRGREAGSATWANSDTGQAKPSGGLPW